MLTRDAMLSTIGRLYEARCNGDKDGIDAFLAPGAVFTLNGVHNAMADFAEGPAAARGAIAQLIDRFTFHSVVRLTAVTEGERAAVHSRIVVSTGGGDPVTTEIFDLFTFDADGRVRSLVQFADTAMVMRMAG